MSSKDVRLLMLMLKPRIQGTDFMCDQLEIDLKI